MRGKKSFAVGVCLFWSALSASADSPRFPLLTPQDGIWTDRPTRIDRSSQTYERIPGIDQRYTLLLKIGGDVRFADGASFERDGIVYLVAGVSAPSPDQLCRTDDGRRFVCGARSRAFLRKTTFGHYLECTPIRLGRYLKLIDCRLGARALSEILVSSGHVRSVSSKFDALEDRAMAQRSGLWADPACRAGNCDAVR